MPSATCCCLSPLPFQFTGTVQFPPPCCNMVQDPAEAAGPGLQHQRAGDGWQQLCEAGSKGQKKEKKQEYLGDDLSSKPKDEPLPHKS